MKWSRNRRKITMIEAADHLNQLGIFRKIDKKHIEYWERIATKKEDRDKFNPRLPHPNEITALIAFYRVNGLWVHLAHLDPNLSPEPPAKNISSLYGHSAPKSEAELIANKRLARLSEEEIKQGFDIMKKLIE